MPALALILGLRIRILNNLKRLLVLLRLFSSCLEGCFKLLAWISRLCLKTIELVCNWV
jgi:hypothetical protein